MKPLTFRERAATTAERYLWRAREYMQFDSALLRWTLGLSGLTMSAAIRAAGQAERALRLETTIHRGAFLELADRVIERRIAQLRARGAVDFQRHIDQLCAQPATAPFFKDPARLLGKRALVVKAHRDGEKGAVILDYSFVFPLLARFFDLPAIARRYHIVLEPSWSGSCDLDLLCLTGFEFPVFVQTHEPRDIAFLERLASNLIAVPTAANWWVDPRVFKPLTAVERNADIIMVASWARFKRHERLLHALAQLRARGEHLKAIFIGYNNDLTRADIVRFARYHGVADQIELLERVSPDEVNRQLNRVKVNVVWSRREGSNRAIIEGFYAGVPAIVREGFNYGYPYPFLNARTGCFVPEESLADRLLDVIHSGECRDPREWALEHISPQIATRIVDEHIGHYCREHGEKWTDGQLSVKISSLDAMTYWDEAQRRRFDADYAFLAGALRRSGAVDTP